MGTHWHEKNIGVVKLKLEAFAKNEAKKEVLKWVRLIASQMVDFIDTHFQKEDNQYPEWTANLHDATGMAIYDEGRLDRYFPTARASGPQQGMDGSDEYGAEMLEFAAKQGTAHFSEGLWLVMFSASSYAETIENIGSPKERGVKFFTNLWEQLDIKVYDAFGSAIVSTSGMANVIKF